MIKSLPERGVIYMCIQSIRCGLPLCSQSQDEQTECSRNFRITCVVLGVMLLFAGITVLSGAFGNLGIIPFGNLGIIPGWACVAAGIVLLGVGLCMRCIKESKDGTTDNVDQKFSSPNLSNLPYTPPKSDFLPYTPPKVDNSTLTGSSHTQPSAPLSAPTQGVQPFIIKQSAQSLPKLSQLHESLLACVGHLNQFQILLNQRGILTQNIYEGVQLHNYLSTGCSELAHPLEGSPNLELLTKWKALIDTIDKAESDLCSAFYSRYKSDYKPPQLVPGSFEYKPIEVKYDAGGLKYNNNTFSYEFEAPSVKTKSPKVKYKAPKIKEAQGEKFSSQELTCLTSISKSLNLLRYCLAEGYYSCNLRDEAFDQMKKHNVNEVKEPFFFKLAKDYYQEGNRINTVKMLKGIYHFSNEKENFFYRLAEDYYKEGDRENAVKMIKETYHDTERKEKFFYRLAENYCQEGNKEMAAKMLKEISHNTKKKEAFMHSHSLFVF